MDTVNTGTASAANAAGATAANATVGPTPPASGVRLVAIGGGTGLPLVLRAAVALGIEPTAVVTMADDGGSTGRLRRDLGILPPGDVRKCMVALTAPDRALLGRLLNYRFESGEGIAGHALGNLMLAALADITGSFEDAVKLVETLLETRGRVLPSTFVDVTLRGFDRAGDEIFGQVSLANNTAPLADVALNPADAAANPEAVDALHAADVIVICPGSLFTSIIPNLLVPGILAAVRNSGAQLVYIANVANMLGETAGFTVEDYVAALEAHGLAGRIDTIIAGLPADPEHPFRHEPIALTAALQAFLGEDRRGSHVIPPLTSSPESGVFLRPGDL